MKSCMLMVVYACANQKIWLWLKGRQKATKMCHRVSPVESWLTEASSPAKPKQMPVSYPLFGITEAGAGTWCNMLGQGQGPESHRHTQQCTDAGRETGGAMAPGCQSGGGDVSWAKRPQHLPHLVCGRPSRPVGCFFACYSWKFWPLPHPQSAAM